MSNGFEGRRVNDLQKDRTALYLVKKDLVQLKPEGKSCGLRPSPRSWDNILYLLFVKPCCVKLRCSPSRSQSMRDPIPCAPLHVQYRDSVHIHSTPSCHLYGRMMTLREPSPRPWKRARQQRRHRGESRVPRGIQATPAQPPGRRQVNSLLACREYACTTDVCVPGNALWHSAYGWLQQTWSLVGHCSGILSMGCQGTCKSYSKLADLVSIKLEGCMHVWMPIKHTCRQR